MAAFKPKIYEWSHIQYSVPAEIVGKTCEKLEAQYGSVTNENFLDAARAESSPTHPLFEWDDSIAAERYRKDQSSRILSNLRITIASDNSEPKMVRAVYNVKPGNENANYRSFDVVMRDADLRKEVLKRAIRELVIFKEKYETLKELADVFSAIDAVVEKAGDE